MNLFKTKSESILILSTFCLILTWFIWALGVGKSLDLILLKFYNSISPKEEDATSQVVIVDVNSPYHFGSEESFWQELIKLTTQLEAIGIISPQTPSNLKEKIPLNTEVKIFTGFSADSHHSTRQDSKNEFKLLRPLQFQSILYGFQFSGDNTLAKLFDSVELEGSQNKPVWLDFQRWDNFLPRILIEDWQHGKIPESLFKDKWILLDFFPEVQRKQTVPDDTHTIRNSEFYALALETLITGKNLKILPIPVMLLLQFLWIVFSIQIIQKFPPRWILHLLLLSILLILSATAPLLWFTSLWLAPSLFLFLSLSLGIGIIIKRHRDKELLAKDELTHLERIVSSKIIPQNYITSDHHWRDIMQMISQYVSIEKSIFLEKLDHKNELKEIHAYNCSLSDIKASLNNIEKEPYKSAIDANKWRLDKEYLPMEETAVQYLIPLKASGRLIGFWAFCTVDGLDQNKTFRDVINQIADQVSNILVVRKQWTINKNKQKKGIASLLSLKSDTSDNVFHDSIHTLRTLYELGENIIHTMHSASILFDLFGNPVQTNRKMERTLQEFKIKVYGLTLTDLIQQFSGDEEKEVRTYLRKVLRDGNSVSVLCDEKNHSLKGCLLFISPVANNGSEDSGMFGLTGILVEIIDVRYVYDYLEVRQEFLRQSYIKIRQEIAPLSMASDLIEDAEKDIELLPAIREIIQERNSCISELLDSLSGIVEDGKDGTRGIHPIRADDPVKLILADLETQIKNKGIQIEKDWPTVATLVNANLENLKKVISGVINILIEDAYESSIFNCAIKEKEDSVTLIFSNNGVGMNQEELDSLLNDDIDNRDHHFQSLYELQDSIREWSATFSAKSEIGTGLVFSIQFPKLFDDSQ